MDLRYSVRRPEIKYGLKYYSKKLSLLALKAGALTGIYYGIYQIKNHLSEIKDMCNLYEDKAKQDIDRQLLLSFYLLTTVSALGSCIYLVADTAWKQYKIQEGYKSFEIDLNIILKSVTDRAHMINTLGQFYSNRISRDNIMEMYNISSENDVVITDEQLDEIIRNNPPEGLQFKSRELANEFLKLSNRKLELDLIKDKSIRNKMFRLYRFDGSGYGIIISVAGLIVTNTGTTVAGLVVEQTKVLEILMSFAKEKLHVSSNENDYMFKQKAEKIISDLRIEYEKVFGFNCIPFDEVFRDEYHGYIQIDEIYKLDGSKQKYQCNSLDKNDEYYERLIPLTERFRNLVSSCTNGVGQVFTCTRNSGYEALQWGSTTISKGAGVVRDVANELLIPKNLNDISSEEMEMYDIPASLGE